MKDRELIYLLAKVLQECQFCRIIPDDQAPYFMCPICEVNFEYYDKDPSHDEGCRLAHALHEFEEWTKAPYTEAVKALRGE